MPQSDSLIKTHAKSFYWSGFFLSPDVFTKCSHLYDFCRTLDNIADQPSPLEKKISEFKCFKSQFIARSPDHPIIQNMWSLVENEQISVDVLMDLFDGIESDLKETVQLETTDDLFVYAYRVGGTVGLMMSKILQVRNKDACKGAIDLGIAMQLTNIARDVVEDMQTKRYYIPHRLDAIFQTIYKADDFYASAFPAIKAIPISNRLAILVARRVYRKIGHLILKNTSLDDYNLAGKTYVSTLGKLWETGLAFVDFFRLLFIPSTPHTHCVPPSIIAQLNLDEKI